MLVAAVRPAFAGTTTSSAADSILVDEPAARAREWSAAIASGSIDHRELRARFLTLRVPDREALLEVWPSVAPSSPLVDAAYRHLVEVQQRWLNPAPRPEVTPVPLPPPASQDVWLLGAGTLAAFTSLFAFRLIRTPLVDGDLADAGTAATVAVVDGLGAPLASTLGMYVLSSTSRDWDYSFWSTLLGAGVVNALFVGAAIALADSNPGASSALLTVDLFAVPLGALAGALLGRTALPPD